ncbi:MAG: hypothetical protein PHW00_03200 [Clostridia bacterium]|nr:hypothetical protein [Clostridia bacterium]
MTLKPITCPQCGKILCRAKVGSEVEVHCHACRIDVKGTVDPDGGVHALPLVIKTSSKKAK